MMAKHLNWERSRSFAAVFLAAVVAAWTTSPLDAQDDGSMQGPPPAPVGNSDQAQQDGPPPADGSANPSDVPSTGDDGSAAAEGSGSDSSASFQTFYDALQSQGTWVQSNDYGYVWQPQVSDPDWAPYTNGHWVYTDDGWTWVSDESFGWATYHYGRWVNLDGSGWCWVPGYTWAPAWVSWRYGNGYAGWAPLPPDSFVGVDYYGDGYADGIHIGGDCDNYFGIGAGCYNFLPIGYLGYGNYRGHYASRYDNYGLINRTINVTNINVTRNASNRFGNAESPGLARTRRVTTEGPSLAQVNAVAQTPVPRVRLNRVGGQPGGGGTLANDTLSIYAPHVHAATDTALHPNLVSGSIGAATINRGADIMRPLAVNARIVPGPASEAQVQNARIAQQHAPAAARVVTSASEVRPVFNAPLTSLRPVSAVTVNRSNGPVVGGPSYPGASRSYAYPPGTTGERQRGYSNFPGDYPVNPNARSGSVVIPGGSSRVYSPGGNYPSSSVYAQPRGSAAGEGGRSYAPAASSGGGNRGGSAPAGSSSGGSHGGGSSGGSSGGGGGHSGGGQSHR